MTSNEIRQIVGMMPSKDPGADELRNKNLNQSNEEMNAKKQPEEIQNENEVKV
jgi:FtsZ-binding cell division protein ZapB